MKNLNTFDVVIVGSGIAGLSAAIEAINANVSVCLVEKLPSPGGNSLISDGGIGVVNSDLQQSRSIKDSVELLKTDMLRAGGHINDPELVEIVASQSNEVYEWSKTLGVKYMDRVDIFGGHSVPRCLTPKNKSGRDIVDVLYQHAKKQGVTFYFKTMFDDVIFEDGIAKAIIVRQNYRPSHNSKNKQVTISINKSLIITSGGFGSDKDLIAKHSNLPWNIESTNLPTATGEVINSIETIGGQLIHMEEIQLGPWTSVDEKGFGLGPLYGDYIALPKGILIDPKTAKRIVDETADRKIVSDAMLNIGRFALGLTDDKIIKDSEWDISKLLKKKIVRSFKTLDDLALHYGIRVTYLKESVQQYNELIKQKKPDPLGKDLTDKTTIDTPPFYGMRMSTRVHHTMGGLRINPASQVLDRNGHPLKNLYAAGEASGGIHGKSRLGSMAITECMVMGRIAGKTAAQ